MTKRVSKKYSNAVKSSNFGGGVTLKALSVAALAGLAFASPSANAQDLSNVDLTQKPAGTPTLDYLKANDTVIKGAPNYTKTLEVSTYRIKDNNYNTAKIIYLVKDPNDSSRYLTKDELKNVLDPKVAYKYSESYGSEYSYSSLGVDNLDDAIEAMRTRCNYTEDNEMNDIKTIYRDYVSNLDNEALYPETTEYSSAYIVSEVDTAEDATFEYKTADEEGNVTSRYYKIDFKTQGLDSDSIGVGYEYKEHGYEKATDRINNTLNSENANQKLFRGLNFSSNGGAIYNEKNNSNIDIVADFVENYAQSSNSAEGGAIYNYDRSSIGNLTGDFIFNYAQANRYSTYGGAISNSQSIIENLTGNFIYNYAQANDGSAYGGAISSKNDSSIGNITGDFIGNYAQSNSYSLGGAIYKDGGIIGRITGDFISNYVQARETSKGGAICNTYGVIGIPGVGSENSTETLVAIKGDFIGNHAISTSNSSNSSYGGAIYNGGLIGNISGDFIENYAKATSNGNSSYSSGGAIYNSGTVGNITGNFISNCAKAESTSSSNTSKSYGGAVYNGGLIENIVGDFIGNSATGDTYGGGGAIAGVYASTAILNVAGSEVLLGTIKGDFIENYVKITDGSAIGGAIYNYGSYMGNIEGNFIGNYAEGKNAYGGAIYNLPYGGIGSIGNITGNFINNHAKAVSTSDSSDAIAHGGAIYNKLGEIGNITGDFIGNHVQAESNVSKTDAKGGAIYMDGGIIGEIMNSSFGRNFAKASKGGTAQGGAIWTNKDLNIVADNGVSEFTGNYVQVGDSEKDYQAIYLGKFSGSYTKMSLPQIGDVYQTGTDVPNLTLEAKNNGKIIFNDKITGIASSVDVYRWTSKSSTEILPDGSSKYVYSDKVIDFDNNEVAVNKYWSASNYEVLDDDNVMYIPTYHVLDSDNNEISTYKYWSEGDWRQMPNGEMGSYHIHHIFDSDNNEISTYKYWETSNTEKLADGNEEYVYTYHMLDSDNNEVGTYKYWYESSSGASSMRIYHLLDENNKEIETIASSHGFIPAIDNEALRLPMLQQKSTSINIKGDASGLVMLNNDIEGYNKNGERDALDINLYTTTLHLGVRDNVLDHNNLTLHSGTFNMINNHAGVSALNKLTVTGETNFAADVDLATETMDRFTANEYGEHTGRLNVVGMNLLSDTTADSVAIPFAEIGLKDNVTLGSDGNLPQNEYQTAYTPIYKYTVAYDNRDDAGYFVFNKGGLNSTNQSDNYNPAVLTGPVANVAASQATVNETFKYVFEHADAFTQLPSAERMAAMNGNKYALSTDFNNNNGNLCHLCDKNNKAGWVRAYSTFESLNLKHGPKVNATTYGSLVGFDTDFRELKRGWHSVGTGYIGYNGSQLSYNGVDTSMNGGLVGYTETFYKKNFWTALTLSAGASVGTSNTMYGKEDFTSLMAGVGSKTGYNFEFREGKYILQPIMFMSYTFVNTFDYTNAAGVKIKPSPAHSIQLNPSVRFTANLAKGWQPYASVGMVWNVMNENKVTADAVRLPEMGMKPYVEYGVGVQRNWREKFTAFGQAMLRNGGRNGVALTAGFRWALGDEGKPIEKVHNTNDKTATAGETQSTRTVLKQMNANERNALKQQTTRTTRTAVLKQL